MSGALGPTAPPPNGMVFFGGGFWLFFPRFCLFFPRFFSIHEMTSLISFSST